MIIYNTLTRKKELLKTIEEGKVRIYVCGPTVYNYIHIGNARPLVVFDTLRKYLIYRGYEVKYVQNFTDVDDKIINRAKEEGQDSKKRQVLLFLQVPRKRQGARRLFQEQGRESC